MRKIERIRVGALIVMILGTLLVDAAIWKTPGRLSSMIAGFCGGYLFYVLKDWRTAKKNHEADCLYVEKVVERMNEQKWLLDFIRMIKMDHLDTFNEWYGKYVSIDISQAMCQYYLERISARTEMMGEVAMRVFIGQGYRDMSSGTQKSDFDKTIFRCFLLIYGRWDRHRQYPIVIDPIGHVHMAKFDDDLLKYTTSAAGCYYDKTAQDVYKPNYYFDPERHESFICLRRELQRLEVENEFTEWAAEWIYNSGHDRFHESYPDDND